MTKIEWTDATWNPVVGCSVVSPGCTNCYAMKMAYRIEHGFRQGQKYDGLTKQVNGKAIWTGVVRLDEGALDAPLRWRKPRRIFVNSMSDLFHEALPDVAIDRVFAVMANARHHTFQVLTKRPDRMKAYLSTPDRVYQIFRAIRDHIDSEYREGSRFDDDETPFPWPLPNVWLGVSVEDQARADERIPLLLATPAAVRFLSCEPLLGPVDLKPDWIRSECPDATGTPYRRIDWIIVGGESGPNARPLWTPNVRSIVHQCKKAGVAVFVKQLGANVRDRNDAGFEGCGPTEWPDIDPARLEHNPNGYLEEYQGAPVRIRLKDRKGGDPAEWPEDLRVREFPS